MNELNSRPERLESNFADYALSHKTRGNKFCHFIGIPFIVISLFGLLSHALFVPLGALKDQLPWLSFNAGVLLWAIGLLYYLTLDWRLALPFGLTSLGFYVIASELPVYLLWVMFVLGWALQFVGHLVYEKKNPSFYSNLKHLFIGPLWVFEQIIRRN